MMLVPQIDKIAAEKGKKHKYIAEKLGGKLGKKITQQQFSKWVTGKGKKPDADVLWPLAEILECEVGDLYIKKDPAE